MCHSLSTAKGFFNYQKVELWWPPPPEFFEKYARRIGSFPPILGGDNSKTMLKGT